MAERLHMHSFHMVWMREAESYVSLIKNVGPSQCYQYFLGAPLTLLKLQHTLIHTLITLNNITLLFLQRRRFNTSEWCDIANKLQWLSPFWTLRSLKGQHSQEGAVSISLPQPKPKIAAISL